MKNNIVPLETVNALVFAPSLAFGVEGHPDVVIIDMKSSEQDWATGLDAVVGGCLVLGFKKMILKLPEAEAFSSFVLACIATAWLRLVENGGTLVICGLSESASKRFEELAEPRLFNMHGNLDSAIDWLTSGFEIEVSQGFPRTAKCHECGTVGHVVRRGDHSCPECGMTYLVTERGELLL
jgi:hypothetical protein